MMKRAIVILTIIAAIVVGAIAVYLLLVGHSIPAHGSDFLYSGLQLNLKSLVIQLPRQVPEDKGAYSYLLNLSPRTK
jgi:hypothetical protein